MSNIYPRKCPICGKKCPAWLCEKCFKDFKVWVDKVDVTLLGRDTLSGKWWDVRERMLKQYLAQQREIVQFS